MAVQKILKEDTETAIEVSDEDVTSYAEQLGIDVSKEKHLLWIARKGLETPVPVPWCPVEDEKGRIYYYNRVTDESSWEHPVDEHFRELVKQERDKQIASKERTELGVDSEPSSLDDVPPISSAKNSMSLQAGDNSKGAEKRTGSLHKLHNLMKEEKLANTTYLQSNIIRDKLDSSKSHGSKSSKRGNFNDHFVHENSLILNHTSDDELSTGLYGIGFDRFAEQFGIMDASELSPVIASSQVLDDSFVKPMHQPMPKTLLKTLFNTSDDLNKNSSETRKDKDLGFMDYLKKTEEYYTKDQKSEKSEIKLEENIDDYCGIKNTSFGLVVNTSLNECSEQDDIQNFPEEPDSLANDEKLKHAILEIEVSWKKKLEGKRNEIRLSHEKHIAELIEKLAEEKRIEERKLQDAVLLMKEENAVILSKQELILTEELEADLESAKEEMEMKKLAALQAIQEQEEKYEKEIDERKTEARQEFESKLQKFCFEMEKKLQEEKQDIQHKQQEEINASNKECAQHLEKLKNDLHSEMEKKLEEEKQDIQHKQQDEIGALNNEYAHHLEKLKNDFQLTMEEKQDIQHKQQEEIDALNKECAQHLEKLKNDLHLEMELKLEEEKHDIQLNHEKKIDSLTKENAQHIEELKTKFQENLETFSDMALLKEELNSLKQQVEGERKALVKLQEEKSALDEQKTQLSYLTKEKETLKHNNEEEKNSLLQEKNFLQNKVDELKSELTEQNETLQSLTTKKYTLEKEITFIEEEFEKQKSLFQQKEPLPAITSIDKFTDTCDLLFVNDVASGEAKLECSDYLTFKDEPQHSFQNDKIETLEIKLITLEKAFRLLEAKIRNILDSESTYDHSSHAIKNKILETDKKCKHCKSTSEANISYEVDADAQELFSSKDLKSSSNLPKMLNNEHALFYMPNNPNDVQCYENNLVYNIYSKELCPKQKVNLAHSTENDKEFFPFSSSDPRAQLKHCQEQFRALQTKCETSQLNLELIKKEIQFNDASRKDNGKSNELHDLSCAQNPDQEHGTSQVEIQHTQSISPPSNVPDIFPFPIKSVQNGEWHSPIWQNTQKLIQKEHQFMDEARSNTTDEKLENNSLDQFLILTEKVLDKELNLFSKGSIAKHVSYPTLEEQHSSNSPSNVISLNKSNDYNRSGIHPRLHMTYKPTYIYQPALLSELITEKEDWMAKIENLYQKTRGYERDLTLKRSLKTNI